jgi:hypothetical protein
VLDTREDFPHYPSTLEWFESQGDDNNARAFYRKLYDTSIIDYPSPRGLDPEDDTFRSIRRRRLPEAFVASVPNGCAFVNDYRSRTAVIAPDGKLIFDVSNLTVLGQHRRPEDHWIFAETDFPEPTLIDETAALLAITPQWSRGYYHWLFEVLPRIHLMRGSGLEIEKYLSNPLPFPFQRQTLAAMGITDNSVIELDWPFCVRARELLISSDVPLVTPAWVCNFLRSEFLKSPAPTDTGRIYVSRRDAIVRHVANEDDVREVLASFNFEELVAEELSVHEQAAVFSSASAVVAPHGGGLTNIVFCRPQTKVIEFFAPRYRHAAYWMLASQCNLDYYYVVGRGERAEWSWPAADGAQDPIDIDPDDLVAVLKMAGL